MHKPKRRSNRTDDGDDEFSYDDEPRGRAGDGEDDDDEHAVHLEEDDDDPQPLDRLVKRNWRN